MPRRRKLVKAAQRPVDAPTPVQAPAPQAAPKDAPQPAPRRRLVKKGTEHPAVAQFAGYPEAQARVREALKVTPWLEPTAFSWSPIRMGGPLCAAEAERVMCGKSAKVPGLTMTASKTDVCSGCYVAACKEGLLIGAGWAVTLYEPKVETEQTLRTCLRCGGQFHGEQGR